MKKMRLRMALVLALTLVFAGLCAAGAESSVTVEVVRNTAEAENSAEASEAAEEPQIWLPYEGLTLVVGNSRKLTAQFGENVPKTGVRVQWFSDDMTVATVNNIGRVAAIGLGEANISCEALLRSGEVLRASTCIRVIQPIKGLTINGGEPLQVAFGQEAKLTFEYKPEKVSVPEVNWISWNPEVATVDSDGTVHGVHEGLAKITAEAADGYGANAVTTVQVIPVYADQKEIVFDSEEEKEITFQYEGEPFEENYAVVLGGSSVKWETDAKDGIATLKLKPNAIAEEDRILIVRRKTGEVLAETAIRVKEGTIRDAQKLPVVSAGLISGAGVLTYRFELANNSTEEIGEIGFLVDYRDQFGDTHYLRSNADGTLANFQYTTMFNIQPGQRLPLLGSCEAFRSDDLITEVRLAIFYYRYVESAEKVYIPADQLYWYSSKTGEMERTGGGTHYEAPDVETTDKADRITYEFGATMCDLYPYVCKAFCRSYQSGKYVAAVSEGGWANRWGLKARDVIYGADDLLWESDPFFLNRAFAKVYDGEEVTLKVVRNGEEIELTAKK